MKNSLEIIIKYSSKGFISMLSGSHCLFSSSSFNVLCLNKIFSKLLVTTLHFSLSSISQTSSRVNSLLNPLYIKLIYS